MSNMSYCRFRNTLKNLEDCHDNMWDNLIEMKEFSPEEWKARKQLIELCQIIASDTEDEDFDNEFED